MTRPPGSFFRAGARLACLAIVRRPAPGATPLRIRSAGRLVLSLAVLLLTLFPTLPASLSAQDLDGAEPQIEVGTVEVPRGDLFVRNLDRVWTAAGEVLENVSLLIRNGRIRAIGPDLTAPSGVTVLDGAGRTAIPGLVDAHSHIAMAATNEGSAPIVPEVRVLDALDHEDFGIYRALSGGVTTALVLHGSANPIGGQSAIVKTRWKMDRADQLLVQGAPKTVKFALGENVTRKNFDSPGPDRFPSSRVGVEQAYVEAFEAARAYRRAWEAYRENPNAHRVPPRRDLRLEALVDILEGRIKVHAHSYRADEILMLMRVAERFGFRIDVFQHVLEGYKVASEMAEHGAGGSTFSDWWAYKLEAYDAIPYNAAIMHDHGVLTSINSDIPWLQSFMIHEFNKPVKYGGVPKEEALRMLTLYPARQLHLEDRIGSLEVGKDGDLVLLSGDPFDLSSRVEETVVDGIVYYDRDRDEETRKEPVRDLEPLAYGTLSPRPVTLADWPSAADRALAFPERIREAHAAGPSTEGRAAGGAGGDAGARAEAGRLVEVLSTAPGRDVALVGATVHPVSGPPVEDGVVLVLDGRIAAVGPRARTELPPGVPTVDVSGKHVYPGLIDPNTTLGLVEIGSIPSARDDRTVGAYNPHLRAAAGVDPLAATLPVARAAGITTVLTAPATGVVKATGSVIQLKGDTPEKVTVLSRGALMVDFPSPTGNAWDEPELEGDDLEDLLDLFRRAQLYAARQTVAEDPTAPFGPNVRPGDRVLLEAMLPAVRGEMPVFFEARQERDIRTLFLFLDEFPGLKAVLVGGDHAYRVAEELAGREIPVIVGSERSPTMDRDDPIPAGWENAARLHRAGVLVAFTTGDASDVRTLPEHAARAWAYGLPREIALRGITLAPARILGLDRLLGSLEEGKRADLVVTDGDPLQITTHVERVFIGGEEVSTESKHTRLWKEYRDRP